MKQTIAEKKYAKPFRTPAKLLFTSSVLFGLYAFYLLIEVLDFLALLHSKEPGYSATYDIVHVAYFMVEMVVCLGLALWTRLLSLDKDKSLLTLGSIMALITIFRVLLVYYLYHYSEPEYHFVPYIYKLANPLSNFFRFTFIYLQITITMICTVSAFRTFSALKRLK